MVKKLCACAGIIALSVSLAGCTSSGSTEPSKAEDAQMRKAVKGEGVGPMPEETRKQMEAAMKAHGAAGGVPVAPTPGK